MKYKLFLVSILFFIGCDDEISIVDSPDTKSRNSHYVSNRAPLQPSKLIKLPVGSVKPEGWLLEYFNRQKNAHFPKKYAFSLFLFFSKKTSFKKQSFFKFFFPHQKK